MEDSNVKLSKCKNKQIIYIYQRYLMKQKLLSNGYTEQNKQHINSAIKDFNRYLNNKSFELKQYELHSKFESLSKTLSELKLDDHYKINKTLESLNLKTKTILKESLEKDIKIINKRLDYKKRAVDSHENEILKKCFCSSDLNAVASEFLNNAVSYNDMKLFLPGRWLNDEIINFYMALLQKRSENRFEKSKGKMDYFFNSFFFASLTSGSSDQYDYNKVRRWTKRKKIDIFSASKIFVPININNCHWTLAVINISDQKIYYYDSLCNPLEWAMKCLLRYVKDEHSDKNYPKTINTNFTTENVSNLPKQLNSFDCGMFVCKAAEFLSDMMPLDYSQNDMALFRKRMALEILRRKTDSEVFETMEL